MLKSFRHLMLPLLPITFFAFHNASVAQDYGSYSYPGTDFYANNNTINVAVMNDVITKSVGDSSSSGRTYLQPSTNQQTQLVSTRYIPSKSRTKNNLAALNRRFTAVDPAYGKQLDKLFAENDIIGTVQGIMDQFGLERNNVAHAYALYWVVYWGLASQVYDVPSTAAMRAVATQSENSFAANVEFAALDNAGKQAAAEELMALTAIMDATSEQSKSDPALAAQAAKAALQGSRRSGLQLDEMTLTEDGFVPTKGRKRSDAEKSNGQALAASNDTPSKDGMSNTQLALIAAAGGAGLAGVFLFGKAMGKRG